jgi:hypothetical protein
LSISADGDDIRIGDEIEISENIVDDKIVENSINRLGLYRFYTSIGIYLCKLFDYVQQVGAIAEYDKIVGDYVFLGDLYDGLFPVNKLYPSYKLK